MNFLAYISVSGLWLNNSLSGSIDVDCDDFSKERSLQEIAKRGLD